MKGHLSSATWPASGREDQQNSISWEQGSDSHSQLWAPPGIGQPSPIYTSKRSHIGISLFAGCLHRRQPWGTCRGLCPASDESMQNASESKGKSKENGSPQDAVAETARHLWSHRQAWWLRGGCQESRLRKLPPRQMSQRAPISSLTPGRAWRSREWSPMYHLRE